MKKRKEGETNNPSGLTKKDTVCDAMKRADWLSCPCGGRYAATMLHNKDARRVVLLVREIRRLRAESNTLRTALEQIAEPCDEADIGVAWIIAKHALEGEHESV